MINIKILYSIYWEIGISIDIFRETNRLMFTPTNLLFKNIIVSNSLNGKRNVIGTQNNQMSELEDNGAHCQIIYREGKGHIVLFRIFLFLLPLPHKLY